MAANDDQARFWNGAGGASWIDLQELMDRQLAPLGQAVIDHLAVAPGERVLDVGCGCGATTHALGERTGPTGSVLGVDISEPMLEAARRHAAPHVSFLAADAQTADLGEGRFDAVASRFGVMFFADPVAAFANLARATRRGGRLAFVCWQSPRLNEWASGIGAVGNAVLGPLPPLDPRAPGPFAFADRDDVRGIVRDAGWAGVVVDDLRRSMQVFGTDRIELAMEGALRVGGLSRRMADATEEQRGELRAAVRRFLLDRWTPSGWFCDGVCWLVTATRP
jgi:SAM-dependent methyltransferase